MWSHSIIRHFDPQTCSKSWFSKSKVISKKQNPLKIKLFQNWGFPEEDHRRLRSVHIKQVISINFIGHILCQTFTLLCGGCGSVGRAVAFNTRGLRFESSHLQLLLNQYFLLTVCTVDDGWTVQSRVVALRISAWSYEENFRVDLLYTGF